MSQKIIIKKKIRNFSRSITVDGDKSLSIRWALLASQAIGESRAYNLLKSEDVISTLNALKKLGVKVFLNKNYCSILGNGINSFKYKKNLVINARNSGTLGRLILALLIKSPHKIKIIGDKSLSKRDFSRVINPLKKIGAKFYPNNKKNLPITIQGSQDLKPIYFLEKKGSAQCKSSVMLASLNTPGKMKIKAKKSRNHTEIFFKNLKIPTKIKKTKEYDHIEVEGMKNFNSFKYNIPSDISSSAFFVVLTILSKKSNLTIKNVNINKSRIGLIYILNRMGGKIRFKNKKIYKGEEIADLHIRSIKKLKAINCPSKFNSSAIDEFLIIFLVAAKAKGVSYFKNLSELNQKESPRLKLASKILSMMGIKTIVTKHSIKIFGNPKLDLKKKYIIKNYFKDHRIFMMSTIAALTFGGYWKINDPKSVNTSFPSFLGILKKLGAKIN